MKNPTFLLASAVVVSIAFAATSLSADWPQWRGPNRDGVIEGFEAPVAWPAELSTEWSSEIGLGHASPALVGDAIYTLTRLENKEVIRCLNLKDGKKKWQVSYSAEPKLNSAVGRYGNSPRSTPAVHGGRLFALGAAGTLTCIEAKSGRQLWQHTFTERFKTPHPDFGAAASPLVVGDLCIVPIGGKGRGTLAAFSVDLGQVRWTTDSDGPSYASPVVLELGKRKQIVTQTQNAVIGVSWEGKRLWRLPFTTAYDQNIITAIAFEDILLFSGTRQPLTGIRLDEQGEPKELWTNPAHSLYMSSPVLKGSLLFGMSEVNAGHIFCIDARTGKTLWKSPGRAGENVSVQRAGDVLVLLNEGGKLTFAKAHDKGYDVLKEYQVCDKDVFAHPILAGNRVLIKEHTKLYCYRLD